MTISTQPLDGHASEMPVTASASVRRLELVTADAARLRNPEQAGIDDGGHALGGELAGRIAFTSMRRQRRRNRSSPPHDFIVIDLHTHSISQIVLRMSRQTM